MRVVKFPSTRCTCRHCRAPFRPRKPAHIYCPKCFYAGRASAHIAAAVEFLRMAKRP